MKRAVVCVATTERYQRGMGRLQQAVEAQRCAHFFGWQSLGRGWPTHQEKPYAFKAYALMEAVRNLASDVVLWCDACMLPIRSLEPLWDRIERDGYWMSRNGFTNYEWTADRAYPELFAAGYRESMGPLTTDAMDACRANNRVIPHVVATAFGLNVRHPKGRAFLDEYYRLASETRAFCGPWKNTPETPCGPADVRGHRHDQTAASVIAWRQGFELTNPPEIFAYKGGETEQTILVADGSYL